jgi:hypothetical protein
LREGAITGQATRGQPVREGGRKSKGINEKKDFFAALIEKLPYFVGFLPDDE